MSKEAEKEFFNETYDTDARASVGEVYSIIECRDVDYHDLIYRDVAGKKVLEYGCGEGSHSLEIAKRGGDVVGIDISDVGIRNAAEKAAAEGVDNAEYLVMDAENMTFPDQTFDLVIGEGILHHLDLDKSYGEISRVLKPGGRAIFMEPLGHNPIIAIFRWLTPKLRTEDEHPLMRKDLKLAGEYFPITNFRYYHMTSLAAMAFLKTPWFFPVVRFFDKVDRGIFKAIPFSGLLAWYSIMIMEMNPEEQGV